MNFPRLQRMRVSPYTAVGCPGLGLRVHTLYPVAVFSYIPIQQKIFGPELVLFGGFFDFFSKRTARLTAAAVDRLRLKGIRQFIEQSDNCSETLCTRYDEKLKGNVNNLIIILRLAFPMFARKISSVQISLGLCFSLIFLGAITNHAQVIAPSGYGGIWK
jgi:hypothetical protein